jgi:two-component system OmpR family response regulator
MTEERQSLGAANVDRRILIVDDNEHVRSSVRFALEDAGYEVREAADSTTARFEIAERTPDAVILDVLLGADSMSGLDVLKWMRSAGIAIPALILTTMDRQSAPDILQRTYELGGDDYVGKRDELLRADSAVSDPRTSFLFQKGSDTAELIARIRKMLPDDGEKVFAGILKIDEHAERIWTMAGDSWSEIDLQPSEKKILIRLAREPGSPVSKRELMSVADLESEPSLQTRVHGLRRKLAPVAELGLNIVTYHAIGYRLDLPGESV